MGCIKMLRRIDFVDYMDRLSGKVVEDEERYIEAAV